MIPTPRHLISIARNVKFDVHYSVVETGNEYREVLSDIMHPERTLTTHIAAVNDTSCTVTFVFPPSNKVSVPLEHVTMPQINEAIFEGLFLITAHAIRTQALKLFGSYDNFLAHRLNAIIREEHLQFRKMLTPGIPASLTLSLIGAELRRQFAVITIGIEGFVEGKVTFLIPLALLPPNTATSTAS